MPDETQAFARPVRHEANNLFAALSGTIDILLRAAADERDRARVTRMREATTRLEALFKGYLSLAAPPAREGGTDGPQVLALLHPLLVLLLGPGRQVEIESSAAQIPVSSLPKRVSQSATTCWVLAASKPGACRSSTLISGA